MGAINWVTFGGVLVDLIIISMIISNAFWGYRRGLTAVIFKIIVFIISLFIMGILYKPVSNMIIKNTTLDEKIATAIEKNLTGTTLEDGNLLNVENTHVSEGVVNLINSFVTEALNRAEENAVHYVSIQLAYIMIQVGTMFLLFLVSRFFLLLIRFAAELIANLPIIKTFNKTGGLIYGILKGILTIYAILAILSIISPLISNMGIIRSIEDSKIGNSMYNNNIIVNIIMK